MRTFELESAANTVAAIVALAIFVSVAVVGVRVVANYGLIGIVLMFGVLAVSTAAALIGTALCKLAFVATAHLVGYLREAALAVRRRLRSR